MSVATLIPETCKKRGCQLKVTLLPVGSKYGSGQEIWHSGAGLFIPDVEMDMPDRLEGIRQLVAAWADGVHHLLDRSSAILGGRL